MLLEKIINNMNSDSVAYKNSCGEFSYRDIYERVLKLCCYLQSKTDCKRVVFIGNKEVDMIAGFIASAISGITYIPIDSFMPKDRVESIIRDCSPQIIITMEEEPIFSVQVEQIMVEKICPNVGGSVSLDVKMKKDDIYYIIYTSGSTGNPKGVQITYGNLEAFVIWLVQCLDDKKKIVLNQASFSFDLSVADIYYSLFTGSKLVALDTKCKYNDMMNFMINSRVELAVFTPSFAELLLLDSKFSKQEMKFLKTILFCGEKLRVDVVKKLKERFNDVQIINSYGPTETTVAVCMTQITDEMLLEEELPIGESRRDVIKIVDESKQCLMDDSRGEIVILGETVSPGYFGANSDKFIVLDQKRTYLTGDIGYIRNNKLYFCGRKDNQIKYNGYRIELEDITNNLLKLDYIDNAVTICKNKNDKIVNIISFVKLRSCNMNSNQIRKELSNMVPKYMLPRIKIVSEFKLNKNGKIDIKKLEESLNV